MTDTDQRHATARSAGWRAGHRPHLVAVAVCAVVPLADLLFHDHTTGTPRDALLVVLVLAAALAVLPAPRHPAPALLVSGTCAGTAILLSPFTPSVGLAPAVALYWLGRTGVRGRSLIAVAVGAAGVHAATVRAEQVPTLSWHALLHSALVALPVLLGQVVRLRRATILLRVERAEWALRAEREAQRLRTEHERRRIARDLHDVVGHALTTISVQAGVAEHLLTDRPEFARQALGTISSTSRQALAELREIVGVLRDPDGERAPRGPGPSLAALPELVERARAAGMQPTVSVHGEDREVPTGVQAAAYRIAQEALTNVRRHAGPVPVRVDVTVTGATARSPGEVRLTVRNAPAPAHPAAHDTVPAPHTAAVHPPAHPAAHDTIPAPHTAAAHPPAHDTTPAPHTAAAIGDGAGTGLAGMRERAELLGGSLWTGPTGDGGFEVCATLPWTSPGASSPVPAPGDPA